jgi:hypothetical protein
VTGDRCRRFRTTLQPVSLTYQSRDTHAPYPIRQTKPRGKNHPRPLGRPKQPPLPSPQAPAPRPLASLSQAHSERPYAKHPHHQTRVVGFPRPS